MNQTATRPTNETLETLANAIRVNAAEHKTHCDAWLQAAGRATTNNCVLDAGRVVNNLLRNADSLMRHAEQNQLWGALVLVLDQEGDEEMLKYARRTLETMRKQLLEERVPTSTCLVTTGLFGEAFRARQEFCRSLGQLLASHAS